MRHNSQTILLLQYHSDPLRPILLSEAELSLALSEISLSGLRSLLYGLVKKQLISKQHRGTTSAYCLTSLGRDWCRQSFPALMSQTLAMTILISRKAPITDRGFHYLRQSCLRGGGLMMARGVYLFPLGVSPSLRNQIEKLYRNNVVLMRVSEIESGFDWQTITESSELWDVASVYSGISKDVSRLLSQNLTHKSMLDSQKKQISLLINQFILNLKNDTGLHTTSLPEKESPLFLLSQLQKLIQL